MTRPVNQDGWPSIYAIHPNTRLFINSFFATPQRAPPGKRRNRTSSSLPRGPDDPSTSGRQRSTRLTSSRASACSLLRDSEVPQEPLHHVGTPNGVEIDDGTSPGMTHRNPLLDALGGGETGTHRLIGRIIERPRPLTSHVIGRLTRDLGATGRCVRHFVVPSFPTAVSGRELLLRFRGAEFRHRSDASRASAALGSRGSSSDARRFSQTMPSASSGVLR